MQSFVPIRGRTRCGLWSKHIVTWSMNLYYLDPCINSICRTAAVGSGFRNCKSGCCLNIIHHHLLDGFPSLRISRHASWHIELYIAWIVSFRSQSQLVELEVSEWYIFVTCVFVILNMSSYWIMMFPRQCLVPCVRFNGHLGSHIGFSTPKLTELVIIQDQMTPPFWWIDWRCCFHDKSKLVILKLNFFITN